MKLLGLLCILFPTMYGETLQYPTDITSFSFSWTNTDSTTSTGHTTATGPTTPELITDGSIATGETVIQGYTEGMVGEFAASVLTTSQGMTAWNIQTAQIVFSGCMGHTSTAYAYYYDLNGVETNIGDAIVDLPSTTNNYLTTFTAPIASTGVVTNGPIGFHVVSGEYCEGGNIEIREIILEGIELQITDEPSKKPTMAPTKQCKGSLAAGDPHFWPMAVDPTQIYFTYMGLGWHYYLFPCDMGSYDEWPFFLMSYHASCGTHCSWASTNRLILNTKPNPWIIEFYATFGNFDITVGTDIAGQTASDFNKNIYYTEANPLIIQYNDGGVHSGELRLFYDGHGIAIQLYNVAFTGHPFVDSCQGEVIDIRSRGVASGFGGGWIAFSCPTCLRNIACGIMGKYVRGDCSLSDLSDPNNECYDIFVGSNGIIYSPPNENNFQPFAASWSKSAVDTALAIRGFTVNYLRNRNFKESQVSETNLKPIQGRALDAYVNGNMDIFIGTDCYENTDRINSVNETCGLNTVVKYEKCCKEIGMCHLLREACIVDLCACGTSFNDSKCLNDIIYGLMNWTCSYKALYPTDAPTTSPTSIIAVLPRGKKAKDFVWLCLVFVILFIVIACGGAAYWYYRKSNVVKVVIDEDEVKIGIQTSTQIGIQTSTQIGIQTSTQNNNDDNINLNTIEFNSKSNKNVAVTFIHYQE